MMTIENHQKYVHNCDTSTCRCRRRSSIKNPHIEEMKEDVLYHLGLTTFNDDLQNMFGDVKFVCVGGTPERMMEFAQYVNEILRQNCSSDKELGNVSKSSRYALFKAGPVLCVSHGIGSPSISVVLHEIMKLMHHAGAQDPIFLRIGTCGGLGIPPGSVVISSDSVDGMLRPYQELLVLGQKVQRPSTLDKELSKELLQVAKKHLKECSVVVGRTMCADDFYEGQGRLDGAFCDYSQDDKLSYLKRLRDEGVVNIEMESLTFAAMCQNAGVKGAVICVTFLDRLKDDQVTASADILKMWQKRVLHLAAMYIKEKLNGEV
ncbi:uridine phosphorylase 2-like isoform X2 [Uloborus diversus]|uniref:uridine phosphorylase 2-like isoform X2 n=1 Tax=Uloborus diversus TaxID=327109 RepID=UPI002409A09D|nr:uridine phosphorylase 2-like isoform X2 [Uloborus diversus]